ncbi:MAG: radical SAM protein [Candidatus Omnitrophota bacterium]
MTNKIKIGKIDSSDKKIKLKLFQIELALEKRVIFDIRRRQKRIPGLKQDSLKYTAYWGNGSLTTGCRDCCLKGKWAQIRTTSKCNTNCIFCYYYDRKESQLWESIPKGLYCLDQGNRFFEERDMRLFFEVQGEKHIKGAAWLFFEPLMELDKIPSLMKFIHNKGYYQWLYTNGILATEDNLKILRDAGLDEIRFNLAATNCSSQVIKHMKIARKYFKFLCIESPMFTGFFNSFIKKKKEILDTGVDHIHLAELQIFSSTIKVFKKEGPIYRYKLGYISPIKSRQLTYDLFDIAVKEGWKNVVLHDCSNELKFYRGVHANDGGFSFGVCEYGKLMELPDSFYEEVLRRDDLEWG